MLRPPLLPLWSVPASDIRQLGVKIINHRAAGAIRAKLAPSGQAAGNHAASHPPNADSRWWWSRPALAAYRLAKPSPVGRVVVVVVCCSFVCCVCFLVLLCGF